jgi:hypothetical protein
MDIISSKAETVLYIDYVGDGFLYPTPNHKYSDDLIEIKDHGVIFNHEIVVINYSDKNGIYYNVNESTFPKVKYLFVFGSTCSLDLNVIFPNTAVYVSNVSARHCPKAVVLYRNDIDIMIRELKNRSLFKYTTVNEKLHVLHLKEI